MCAGLQLLGAIEPERGGDGVHARKTTADQRQRSHLFQALRTAYRPPTGEDSLQGGRQRQAGQRTGRRQVHARAVEPCTRLEFGGRRPPRAGPTQTGRALAPGYLALARPRRPASRPLAWHRMAATGGNRRATGLGIDVPGPAPVTACLLGTEAGEERRRRDRKNRRASFGRSGSLLRTSGAADTLPSTDGPCM